MVMDSLPLLDLPRRKRSFVRSSSSRKRSAGSSTLMMGHASMGPSTLMMGRPNMGSSIVPSAVPSIGAHFSVHGILGSPGFLGFAGIDTIALVRVGGQGVLWCWGQSSGAWVQGTSPPEIRDNSFNDNINDDSLLKTVKPIFYFNLLNLQHQYQGVEYT